MQARPFALLSAAERSDQRTALLSAVVEVLYKSWQHDQDLTMEQITAEVLDVRSGVPVAEIHRAVARLECTGHIEMVRTDQWRRIDAARSPRALKVCGTPACQRPAGHGWRHVPDREDTLRVQLVVDNEAFFASWTAGQNTLRIYPPIPWPGDTTPVHKVPVPSDTPFTDDAIVALLRSWFNQDENGVSRPEGEPSVSGDGGQLVYRNGYTAVWRQGSPAVEIYPDVMAWDNGDNPEATVLVPNGTAFTGAELARISEQWHKGVGKP